LDSLPFENLSFKSFQTFVAVSAWITLLAKSGWGWMEFRIHDKTIMIVAVIKATSWLFENIKNILI
jgi:hypothetical protein